MDYKSKIKGFGLQNRTSVREHPGEQVMKMAMKLDCKSIVNKVGITNPDQQGEEFEKGSHFFGFFSVCEIILGKMHQGTFACGCQL